MKGFFVRLLFYHDGNISDQSNFFLNFLIISIKFVENIYLWKKFLHYRFCLFSLTHAVTFQSVWKRNIAVPTLRKAIVATEPNGCHDTFSCHLEVSSNLTPVAVVDTKLAPALYCWAWHSQRQVPLFPKTTKFDPRMRARSWYLPTSTLRVP